MIFRLRTRPSKFSDDTLVITENCSFSMKKLKENHETLYCLDPSDNLKKVTYFDCPKSFDKACYDSFFVPTESPNYNLGASIGATYCKYECYRYNWNNCRFCC